MFWDSPQKKLQDHNRFNEIAGLLFHKQQGFFHVCKAMEAVRQQARGIQPAGFQQRCQLFHPQPAAGHQTAANGFMAHAAAPFGPGNFHIIPAAQVVDVADIATRLYHFYSLPEGIVVAAGQDDPVHALSVCFVQHLLDNIALPVIDDVVAPYA